MRHITIALIALAAPVVGWAGPKMPAFAPEIQPMVGTWKRVVKQKKVDDVTLFLVIKQDDGQLRLRYQLPNRDKKYSSDWDGQLELDMQVNIKRKHETTYQVVADPPGIQVTDNWRYTGTWKNHRTRIQAVYSLTADGKLAYSCRSIWDEEKDKELPCFAPFEYERVSESTKWPD